MDPHGRRVDYAHGVSSHAGRARRVQRGFGVLANPVQHRYVSLDISPGRDLSTVERSERRLIHDVAGHSDGLSPLLAVLLRRQVVEQQLRLLEWVVALDPYPPAAVGEHGPDVELVAVPSSRHRPVVADGNGQEVEHQIRPPHLVVTAQEPAGLEVVRRSRALSEQPLQTDPRPAPTSQVGGHRHRLGAGVLHVHLEVVLKVLPHPGQIHDR